MSITRMRKSFAHVLKPILIGIALVFFVSIFFMYGGNMFPSGKKGNSGNVATVNNEPITMQEYTDRLQLEQEMMKRMGKSNLSALEETQVRQSVLSSLINNKIHLLAAQKRGISLGWREAPRERAKMVKEQIDQYRRMYQGRSKKKLTDREFNSLMKSNEGKTIGMLRKELNERLKPEAVEQMLMVNKLEAQLHAGIGKIDDARLKDNYKEAKIREIFFQVGLTPDAQVKRKADEVMKKIKAGEDFAKLAGEYSDDKTTKDMGGEVPNFIPVSYLKDTLKYKGDLKPGEVSDVVKMPSGYIIVKVEETKINLPPNFDKKKKDYRDQLKKQLEEKVVRDYYAKMEATAKVKVLDPELNGYWLANKALEPGISQQESEKRLNQAITSLNKAIKENADNPYVYAKLSEIYYMQRKLDKAIAIMEDILDKRQLTEHVNLRKMLAQMYMENNQKDKAILELQDVSEMSYDAETHLQLQMQFKQLGRDDLAKKESQWLNDNPEARAAMSQQSNVGGPSPAPPAGNPKNKTAE